MPSPTRGEGTNTSADVIRTPPPYFFEHGFSFEQASPITPMP
jgi:hypothetical protein